MLSAGKLTQRVTFQTRQTVKDDYGQDTITWVNSFTVWAQVLQLRGREFFAAAQVNQEHSVKVTIRYRTDVTETMRLLWNGQPYDITGVIALGGVKEALEIIALAGVKDGR